ncbi:alpha/beta hydrolase-fold protein [Rheinheimera sp. 1928-s]|uniref:alpha/beta hydrolase n=1 Tax=Rheinheimera sp. 1928-s TaxID=3033803 RepID=UPI00260E9583|nr:alpha/beta hydrolase-fold protein [Rheinheimera sp. 1928-s]MDF3125919.1 alpha/beta hydrolase-fold protein [Rheinheimera sp. 1928-s]
MHQLVGKLVFMFLVSSVSAVTQAADSLGKWHGLDSKVMQERRNFAVYLPPSYGKSNKEYPVIYLLDGDQRRLNVVAGIQDALSTEILEQQVNEAIIVAIPNSELAIRERDLTPTNVDWVFKGKLLEDFDNIGQADRFIEFFRQELIPQINAKYRTSDKRILVGESFGGLFAAHTLLSQPDVFTDYLIIDPTSLWDNNYLNRKYIALDYDKKLTKANVWFSFANNEAFGDIGATNYQWGMELVSRLKKHPTVKVSEQFFQHESHGTVALQSWYFGLLHLNKKTQH